MSVRSFTVFQDTPTEIQKINHGTDKNIVLSTSPDAAATLLSTLAAIEKENLHPLTGQRAAQTPTNPSKKRKTAVLVTKVLPTLSSNKVKHVKSPKKSRKSSSSNGKSSDTRKKSARSSRSARKASPLPRVDEEQETLTPTLIQPDTPPLAISQSNIDSRCYELTVSPLADVSEAYDTATEISDQDSIFDKEQSLEPEIRDYFSPTLSHSSLPSHRPEATPKKPSNTHFSTPERKQIYSAFTFSSPSPSSQRFREVHSSPTCDSNASNSD